MGADTKKQALVKLAAITNRIGYPDKWRDYSTLEIVRGDALGNSQRANQYELQRRLNKIGKARRQTRLALSAHDGQCQLQREPEQHHLPRRHSAAAVLMTTRRTMP